MKSPFAITFVGLKLGLHEFEFDIDKSFFESLPYSLIENGRLTAYLELEKKETMLIANLGVVGFIFTDCDRCTEPLTEEIDGEFTLYYTFGEEESEDEKLVEDDKLLERICCFSLELEKNPAKAGFTIC